MHARHILIGTVMLLALPAGARTIPHHRAPARQAMRTHTNEHHRHMTFYQRYRPETEMDRSSFRDLAQDPDPRSDTRPRFLHVAHGEPYVKMRDWDNIRRWNL